MSLWMCLFYGRLTSLLAAQQAVPFHQPILPCTVARAQSSSRCQHQLQDLSLPQHRLKANAQPQGWGEVLFSIFLPCFLPPFQTPACLWQTALVCRASGSQGNAECWCPHFCFQGSKVPKSTVVANVLTPLLCRHHTLHKPEASSCPLCKCSPQDSTHSPCSSVTIHYSSQLLEQAYELTAEKQHHPYAMESCLRQKIKWNKIKDKTLPPNISCSPSLCHSSTRFTNSKLNYRSEKKRQLFPQWKQVSYTASYQWQPAPGPGQHSGYSSLQCQLWQSHVCERSPGDTAIQHPQDRNQSTLHLLQLMN